MIKYNLKDIDEWYKTSSPVHKIMYNGKNVYQRVLDSITPPTPVFNGKFKFTLTDSSVVTGECDSTSAITTENTSYYKNTLVSAEIGNCVTNISNYAFEVPYGLVSSFSSVTIPDSVTTFGSYVFHRCSGLTSVVLPNSITSMGSNTFKECRQLASVNIPTGLTEIPINFAFNCYSLQSIDIPSNITTINDGAFSYCSGLTSVTIPSGVTSIGFGVFQNCSGLTSITVNATTPPTLGNEAFDNGNNCPIYVPCESVSTYKSASGWSRYASRITCHYEPQYRTITSTTCINTDKWQQDEYQVSIDGGETWTTTGTSATTLLETNSYDCGYRTRTITSTTCIGADKWQQDEYQVSTDAGETWTTTGTSAITLIESQSYDCGYRTRQTSGSSYCNGYDKYIDVYDQVSEDYGESWTTTATTPTLVEADSEDCGYVPPVSNNKFEAFYNDSTTYSEECDSDSTLRTGTTQNGGLAKYSGMTSAVVGDCITTLGSSVFGYFRSLQSVTIPNSVTRIYGEAFQYCYNLTSVGVKGSGASVEIPSGVTIIDASVFANCTGLTSVTIGNQITEIGYAAFAHCSGLTSCTIGNGVTTIDAHAFGSCSSLTDITIPSGVTSIGGYAFANCTNLQSVTINATVPPSSNGATSNWYAFNNTNNCPIYVPSGSVNAYKSASGWSSYASRIYPIP